MARLLETARMRYGGIAITMLILAWIVLFSVGACENPDYG